MVTFFADGSKISFEQAIVANTTDVRVDVRGMHGPTVESGSHVDQPLSWYPEYIAESATGIVDYVVGASPGLGVFVLGTHNDPAQRHYLNSISWVKALCTASTRPIIYAILKFTIHSPGLYCLMMLSLHQN
jgi:predicted homoserine dehydrogenase-like protein